MQYKSYRYNSESIIQQYHKSKNRLFISQFSMTSQTVFAATMLLVGVLNLQLNHFYDTIIIGAGIAGIGASMVLSNNSVAHLLLEARSRIGGRINSFDFANTTQEMGAAFVQFPRENNIIHHFVSALKITEVPVNFQKQTYWYANKSRCTETMLDSVQPVFNSLLQYIYKRAKASNKDEPVSNLVNAFWNTKPNFNGFIKDTVMQYMQTIAVDNGAQLCNLSTLQFNNPDPWDKYDYCPSNGYASFMNSLFNTYCKPKLHLSQIVSKIDYSGCSIAVTTNKKTYTTNKLIIGVPLGILKAGSIEFAPSLPSDKSQAIKSIGNGYFQKLFVTFSSSFWPANSSNLQFITKQNPNRYPEAWVVPSVFSKGLNMLVFWISGDTAKEISGWTINQVKANLIATLVSYIPQAISITNIYLTNWQQDPFTLGSYSFSKVGTKKQDFLSMKTVLRSSVNRLWFVGEYVDPEQYSFSHGAFKTGVQAAKESLLP